MTCEMPDAFRSMTRKANKNHICCECRKVIIKQSTYIYCSGIWNGSPHSYKTCTRCDRIRTLVIKKYPPVFEEEGPAFGELIDYISEMRNLGRKRPSG